MLLNVEDDQDSLFANCVQCLDFISRNYCPTEITLAPVVQNFITGTTVKWSLFKLGMDISDLKWIIFCAIVSV